MPPSSSHHHLCHPAGILALKPAVRDVPQGISNSGIMRICNPPLQRKECRAPFRHNLKTNFPFPRPNCLALKISLKKGKTYTMNRLQCALTAAFIFLTASSLFAQETAASKICATAKTGNFTSAKVTVADPAEDDYDVKHVFMKLSMNNLNTAMTGNVTTKATVVASSMNAYVFELNAAVIIDSVFVNGQLLPASGTGVVRTVSLPNAFTQNTAFTSRIVYHGQVTGGGGFFAKGIRTQTSPTWGASVTYTLSESYASRDWWPCKQSLTDKIDSADMWITVPDNCKAGSNGLLQNVTSLPNSKDRYEWKTTYPIDYYLLSAAVSTYTDYSFKIALPGVADSLLYQNYIYDNPQTLPFWKDEIDSVAGMIQYLSTLFGTYPFYKEKYGHSMAPLGGGIEHQTMTTLGTLGTTLTVHELGHQWFGDHVTCGTWSDIWLNEGFASYIEYLYVDHFRSANAAFNYMADVHDNVLSEPDGSVYVIDTTDENRIFDARLSYDKGSAVIHTLRFLVDNDSLFFAMLRGYQSQFAFSTATTAQFNQYCSAFIGKSLDTFINQWILGEGYPVYNAAWAQSGNDVFIRLNETTTANIPFFFSPIEIKLTGAQGDTIVRLNHMAQGQVFNVQWSKPVAQIAIDPNNWLLNKVSGISNDPTLDVTSISAADLQIFPNPTSGFWTVLDVPLSTILQLTDISGRQVWQGFSENGMVKIPAENLPSGVYLLRLQNETFSTVKKLVKE